MRKIIIFAVLLFSFGAKAQKEPTLPPRTNGVTFPKDSSLAAGYMLIPTFNSPAFTGYVDRAGTNFGLRSSNNRLSVRGTGQWLEFPSYTEVQGMIASGGVVSSVFGRTGAVVAQSSDYSALYDTRYIVNGTSSTQSAGFRIDGNGTLAKLSIGTVNFNNFLEVARTTALSPSAENTIARFSAESSQINNLIINARTNSGSAVTSMSIRPTNSLPLDLGTSGSLSAINIGSTGIISFANIPVLVTPATVFLVSNSGVISRRSPSEVLSDIGGVPSFNSALTGSTSISNLTLINSPATSAGTYDLLTRNLSTGVVEKISSGSFGSGTVISVTRGLGISSTGTSITTTGTVGVDTTVIRSVANSYSLSGLQTKLNGYVTSTRSITTTFPLTGGGDLSANRVIGADTSSVGLATKPYVNSGMALKANVSSIGEGTYTPTLSAGTNISSVTARLCHFMRIGNQVTVMGYLDCTTSGLSNSVIYVSLPVASNIGLDEDLTGQCTPNLALGNPGYVTGYPTGDQAQIEFNAIAITSSTVRFSFMYTVIP